ncbi:MAG: HDIG domain-containing protein, partial [Armatimonadetes bacterium]|nr:HDIG domain-containing protein [Anaerolineae bacterium]
ESARQIAIQTVADERLVFQRGQIVVRGGAEISALEYEALEQLGILQPPNRRWQAISRALIAVLLVMVVIGLYLTRFSPALLLSEPRLLVLLAAIFLLVLAGSRLALTSSIYLFPTSLLALLYVAIINPQLALIGTVSLAMLTGIMADASLETALAVLAGGVVGGLTLRRPERLNSYFVAGLLVALVEMTVAIIFNLSATTDDTLIRLPTLLTYGLLNGLLTAAATVVGLYIIGLVFNLPTALRLIELSQPSQPLLQRLLREAPGTYQHSLQVANLSEQAANAIGANATLCHVAALYHDIGKTLNPAFFTENQRDIGNPHDSLNDPYRSADIIISHVTEGDTLARQQRLPRRLRDFILEHHGTTRVYVFYKQAVILAGDDEDAVDAAEFTYPGPKPQSRETAILMLADSCEAVIRAKQPGSRQEIEDEVEQVIEGKRKDGQLDESGLTLNDLATIHRTFVDMLKGMFHPRINYNEVIAKTRGKAAAPPPLVSPSGTRMMPVIIPKPEEKPATLTDAMPPAKAVKPERATLTDDDDDTPLPYVPLLPRSNGSKARDTAELRAITFPPVAPAAPPATPDPDDLAKAPENDPLP